MYSVKIGGHFSRRPFFKEAIFLGGHFSRRPFFRTPLKYAPNYVMWRNQQIFFFCSDLFNEGINSRLTEKKRQFASTGLASWEGFDSSSFRPLLPFKGFISPRYGLCNLKSQFCEASFLILCRYYQDTQFNERVCLH